MDVIKPIAIIIVAGLFLLPVMNAVGASSRSESVDQCILVEARVEAMEANMERMRNKIDRIAKLLEELENGYDHRSSDPQETTSD